MSDWQRNSQKFRDLLAAEPEPGQTILRKQKQAYRVEIILLLLWMAALLQFDYEPGFALFGVEISVSHLFIFFILLPLSYIGASAIKHQMLLYYPKGGEAQIARGKWARAGGVLLLGASLSSWLLWLLTRP